MQAEVLAIGDEITSGQRVDTNTAWLSQRLAEIGIPTIFHTSVADDLAACSQVMETALARADIVVSTGGLGPTADDLTRQAMAAATKRDLRLDESSLAHIRHLFESHGRMMPEQNRVQALFPLGSRVIPNPHGTAPGIDLTWEENGRVSRIFALPGVPAEMMEMWEDYVYPELVPAGRLRPLIHHYRLKCFGLGESALEQRLPDLIRRGRIPSVGITVHKATITLRVTAQGDSIDACREQMQSTVQTIHDCLGTMVFGEEDDELQDAVARLLARREATLATIELGTQGTLARWMGSASSGRAIYRGGIVAGCAGPLPPFLSSVSSSTDVDPERLDEIAETVRQLFGCDYALAIAYGGAAPSDEFQFALASAAGVERDRRAVAGHPDIVMERSVKQALNALRLRLLTP